MQTYPSKDAVQASSHARHHRVHKAGPINLTCLILTLAAAFFWLNDSAMADFHEQPNVCGEGSLTIFKNSSSNQQGKLEDNVSVAGNASLTGEEISGATLEVRQSTLTSAVGGYTTDAGIGDASHNKLIVQDSNIGAITGGYKDGEDTTSTAGGASHNTVRVERSTAIQIIGGFTNGTGATSDNTVTVIDSTSGEIHGGNAMNSGDANGNTVTVVNSMAGCIISGLTKYGTACDNIVNIDGGAISGEVFKIIGGQTNYGTSATNNTVNITGAPKLALASIYGGLGSNENADLTSGNVLNLAVSVPVSVVTINNFERISITVPELSATYRTTPYLTLTDANGTNFIASELTVAVSGIADGLTMREGDRFHLIQNSSGLMLGKYTLTTKVTDTSQLVSYTLGEELTDTSLDLIVREGSATPQSAALSEAHAAAGALVVSGADLVAGPGISAAVQAASKDEAPYGLAIFGTISGSSMRYNTGSHVDMQAMSLLTGPVLGVQTAPGRLTVGAFFEYGTGSYTVEKDITGPDLNGDGSLYYMGAGILARMDFLHTGPGHFYVEASGRLGSVHNNFGSSDARLASRINHAELDYDVDNQYSSLHAGLGYIWEATPDIRIDIYGKYLYTHLYEDSTTTNTGGHVTHEDFNSSRTRLGARLTWEASEYLTPYVGAAWEYEGDGEAKVSVSGYEAESAELQGSTGIGELGLTFTPGSASPLTIDLNVQGHCGTRQGISGNLLIEYQF